MAVSMARGGSRVAHVNVCVCLCVTGVRNYQIVDSSETTKEKETTLVEIGPRFVLIPIRIFMGSLGGPTLYQNMSYVSPNTERSVAKKAKGYVCWCRRGSCRRADV